MYKRIAGAAAILVLLPAVADAQLLRIGPLGGVRVRAPFVNVDVSPFGGTRVRAPFTAIDTRGRGFLRRGYRGRISSGYGYDYNYPSRNYYAVPAYPTPVPQTSYRVPAYGTPAYGYGYGSGYGGSSPRSNPPIYRQPSNYRPPSNYRQPSNAPYSAPDRTPPPRYDVPAYSDVVPRSSGGGSSDGEWQVGDDPTQLADRLTDAAARLQRSLDRREDGTIWADYLRPDAVQTIGENLVESRSLQAASLSRARSLLGNFDGVAANPSLDWVTQLDGFSDTRQSLQDLVTVLEGGEAASLAAGDSRGASPSVRAPQSNSDRRSQGEQLSLPPPDADQFSGDAQRSSDGEGRSDVEPPPEPRPENRPGAEASQPGSATEPPPDPRPTSRTPGGADNQRQDRRPPVFRGDV